MTSTAIEPIAPHWTTEAIPACDPVAPSPVATAAEVNARLARVEVAEIDPGLVPYLAAAVAELAQAVGVAWPSSTDDPPVALLRTIAKVTMRHPDVGGPHTGRLLRLLTEDAVG